MMRKHHYKTTEEFTDVNGKKMVTEKDESGKITKVTYDGVKLEPTGGTIGKYDGKEILYISPEATIIIAASPACKVIVHPDGTVTKYCPRGTTC